MSLIGLGGFFGSIARYLLSGWTYKLFGTTLPHGTLLVNVIGSFLLGLIMELSIRSALISDELRIAFTIGFLGAFTTFSTFSYETYKLLEDGSLFLAGANIVLNLFLCLFAVWFGIILAKII
ncbi:MAG: fluoride efflux transporter CrcB [Deltaproteobacteria bacterium]|nr:fluoride efflux transporter CrcB [Deltaproteobacteria bacterium]